ncbi:MAG: hypothetical protein F6K24_35205 [Okeania sp. SIO2D1]|nr:hypothetical protein [Okeania sp. SIO2D1]
MVLLKPIVQEKSQTDQGFLTTEKKEGMATVSYPTHALKLKGNQIRVPRLEYL